MQDAWSYRGAVLLALLLPFETVRPLVRLLGLGWTSLELGAVAALGVWLFGRVRALGAGLRQVTSFRPSSRTPGLPDSRTPEFPDSRIPELPSSRIPGLPDSRIPERPGPGYLLPRSAFRMPLFLPAAVFLSAAVGSALEAPAYRGAALKFVGRFLLGVGVGLMTAGVVRDERRLRGLLRAVVGGAGVSALLGLGEFLGGRRLDPWLSLFKEAPSLIGGQRRLSGTFQFATIAAMFFEMAVPLAIAGAVTAERRFQRWLAAVAAVVGTVAVGLTFSRAGLLVLLAVLAWTVALGGFVLRHRPLVLLAGLVTGVWLLTVGLLLGNPTFRLRLWTESDRGWYGARYVVPAVLDVGSGEVPRVVVTVYNTGRVEWSAGGERPFALGYRWLSADGRRVVRWPPTEVRIPHDVPPDGVLQMAVSVPVRLPPGEYRIAWDMAVPGLFGFRHRGVPEAETVVRVRPGPAASDAEPLTDRPRDDMPRRPPSVPRSDLWRAALRMAAERPLLGVGPDNFRRLYGRYLGMAEWDERVHANSLYLELLADLGLVGTAAFLWVIGAVAVRWVQAIGRLRRGATGPAGPMWVGLGGSLLAFLLHGGVDYFLGFTPTYLLFWMVLGMTIRQVGRWADRQVGR
ncbi:hypothetical protein HRbin11_01879 [bacterium HR11]|nr:hypothetical protein HRbin11_01879 [bacterium HR11]